MTGAAILLAILFGAIAGSFLSTVAIRHRSFVSLGGRSRCDACGIPVPAYANVPILSFLLLRGRCAACGGSIDPAHPAMEIGCAAAGGIALALDPGVGGWLLAALGWALALLALIDALEQRLPDSLVFPVGVAGLVVGAFGTPPMLEARGIGVLAGYGSLRLVALVYRAARGREGIGRGDAKLLGAIGAWMGWQPLPKIVLAASLLGLAWSALDVARARTVTLNDRLPFGTLLATAAWGTIALRLAHGS